MRIQLAPSVRIEALVVGNNKKDRQRHNPGILSDHKKIGKRFVPPFLQEITNFQSVEWVGAIMPEILWLSVLNERYGLQRGAALALSLAKAAAETKEEQSRHILFAAASSYDSLTVEQRMAVINVLKSSGELTDLRVALATLVSYYPDCPLSFLYEGSIPTAGDPEVKLTELKAVLEALFDRGGKPATLAQANVVYIAFVTGMLVVNEGLALANFPAVAEFPETEESERVAASVRATVSILLGKEVCEESLSWPRYFWNRGLEIESCSFEEDGNNG